MPAFYHDRYRRTDDGWRISATGYDRTYDATMSLKNLDFKVTPGIALACSQNALGDNQLLGDRHDRAGPQPLNDLHQLGIVDRDTAFGRAAVGGVEEECRTLAGLTVRVDAHHDRVLVLRDLQVLAGIRCRTGTELYGRPAWC